MSDDPVSVDVSIEVTEIIIDAVALDPVEAIDVTSPPTTAVVIDAIMLTSGAIDVTVPAPTPIAVDVVTLDPTEAIEVTVPVASPIAVEPIVILGGPPGPAGPTAGTGGAAGSVTPISPGTIAYIGIGWSVTESKAEFLVMVPGTVTDFAVAIGATDLGSGSVIVTMRKNGVDTALSVSLFGVDPSEYIAGSVAFAMGDRVSIKADVSADVASNVIVTATWRLVPT